MQLYTKHVPGPDGAPMVVFLHGLFGQGKNFFSVAKTLASDFTSVLVDLPNHGHSPHSGDCSYEHMADHAATVCRDLAAGSKVHLVGHSMGGKVAMMLALKHPQLIDRLVIEDISPVTTTNMSEFDHLLGALRQLDLSALAERKDAEQALEKAIPDDGVRLFLLQNLRQKNGQWYWLANLELLHNNLDTLGAFPAPDASFAGKVLWMGGSRSPYIRAEHQEVMDRLFPKNIHVTIKDAGHWIHSEQPASFVSALRTFLTHQ